MENLITVINIFDDAFREIFLKWARGFEKPVSYES